MSAARPFIVELSAGVPAEERQRLLLVLSQHATLQEAQAKDPTVETVVAVIKSVGEVAGAIGGVASLVKLLLDWREEARRRGVRGEVVARRPQQPPLDLMQASEGELLAWLLEHEADSTHH